jgi:hypothetical protein
MDDPSPSEPQATTAEIATPAAYPSDAPAEQGVNLPLLGVLLGILLLVIASNVWLRRRAEREESAGQDDPT